MLLVLLVVLIILSLGGLPTWGWHSAGYYPSGVGVVLIIILIVVLFRGGL